MEEVVKAISAAFKMPETDLAALLKDGDEYLTGDDLATALQGVVSDRVKLAAEQARKGGQREQNQKIAAFVRKAGFDNPDKLQGEALLEAYAAWSEENAPAPAVGEFDKIPEKDLLKFPNVKALIEKNRETVAAKLTALEQAALQKEQELAAFKNKVEQEKVLAFANDFSAKALKEAGVMLEVDGVSPDLRIKSVLKIATEGKRLAMVNDDLVFLGEDDDVERDEYGKPVSVRDSIVNLGKQMFGASKTPPGQGGGGMPPAKTPGQGGADAPRKMFANVSEYNAFMLSETDPALRAEGIKSWAHHSTAAG